MTSDIDPFAPFEFQLAATELFRAEVEPFSDEVLRNEHVGPDLVAAAPLWVAGTPGGIDTRYSGWTRCLTTQPWAKLYGLRNHLPVIDFPTSMTGESDASRG